MKWNSPQNLLIAIGGIACLISFIWGINTEDRDVPRNIFFVGAALAMIGIFLNILLLKFSKPLKLFAIGVLVVCIGILFENTSTHVLQTLKIIGFIIAGVAVAWHAYEIVRNDKNL